MSPEMRALVRESLLAKKHGNVEKAEAIKKDLIQYQTQCQHEPFRMIKIGRFPPNHRYQDGGRFLLCKHCNCILYYEWPESGYVPYTEPSPWYTRLE